MRTWSRVYPFSIASVGTMDCNTPVSMVCWKLSMPKKKKALSRDFVSGPPMLKPGKLYLFLGRSWPAR